MSHWLTAFALGEGSPLAFLSARDLLEARRLCAEARRIVAKRPITCWFIVPATHAAQFARAFPRATKCRMRDATDAALSTLAHIQHLDIAGSPAVTDAGFAHLINVVTLNMSRCRQRAITDAAFANLRRLRMLDMSGCNQISITDGAFEHLRDVHTLNMSGADQVTITDAAFAPLRGVRKLNVSDCQITDGAFKHLQNVQALDLSGCLGVTDAAFVHLRNIQRLDMRYCCQDTITDAAFARVAPTLRMLILFMSRLPNVTSAGFAQLTRAQIIQ